MRMFGQIGNHFHEYIFWCNNFCLGPTPNQCHPITSIETFRIMYRTCPRLTRRRHHQKICMLLKDVLICPWFTNVHLKHQRRWRYITTVNILQIFCIDNPVETMRFGYHVTTNGVNFNPPRMSDLNTQMCHCFHSMRPSRKSPSTNFAPMQKIILRQISHHKNASISGSWFNKWSVKPWSIDYIVKQHLGSCNQGLLPQMLMHSQMKNILFLMRTFQTSITRKERRPQIVTSKRDNFAFHQQTILIKLFGFTENHHRWKDIIAGTNGITDMMLLHQIAEIPQSTLQ